MKKTLVVIIGLFSLLALLGFVIYAFTSGGGPMVPSKRVELSLASFDNATNFFTVNAALIQIDNINPFFRQGYYDVKEPFVFVQAQVFYSNDDHAIETVNLAPVEIVGNGSSIKVKFETKLEPEFYSLRLKTTDGGSYNVPFTVGNFVDPQKPIEVKEVWYNSTENAVYLSCNRIEPRTQLMASVVDNQVHMVQTSYYIAKTQTDEGTIVKVSIIDAVTSGQYKIWIGMITRPLNVVSNGVNTPFTVP